MVKRSEPPKSSRAAVNAGRQRGQLWWSGSHWLLRYREPKDDAGHRRRRCITIGTAEDFPTQADARVEADRVLDALFPPQILPSRTIDWSAYCDRFQRTYLPLLRAGSAQVYKSIITTHLEPAFRGHKLHAISTAMIQEWVSLQAEAGVAPATIRSRFRVLRRMLRKATGYQVQIPERRAIDFPRSDRVRTQTARKAFTVEEVQQITGEAKVFWVRVLFALMTAAGLRIGEALGLTWPNVDLGAGTIWVRQQATRGGLHAMKTASSERIVSIPAGLVALLAGLKASQAGTENPLALVFPNPKGQPRSSSGVRERHLRPILKRLDMPAHRSTHGFRHGCSLAALQAGASPAAVRDQLGHASIATTDLYTESTAADRAAMASTLHGLLLNLFEKP